MKRVFRNSKKTFKADNNKPLTTDIKKQHKVQCTVDLQKRNSDLDDVQHSLEIEQKREWNIPLEDLPNADECCIEKAIQHLHNFDLLSEFGPCMGLTRSERYKRALRFGLNPPKSVITVLDRFRSTHPQVENKQLNWKRGFQITKHNHLKLFPSPTKAIFLQVHHINKKPMDVLPEGASERALPPPPLL